MTDNNNTSSTTPKPDASGAKKETAPKPRVPRRTPRKPAAPKLEEVQVFPAPAAVQSGEIKQLPRPNTRTVGSAPRTRKRKENRKTPVRIIPLGGLKIGRAHV